MNSCAGAGIVASERSRQLANNWTFFFRRGSLRPPSTMAKKTQSPAKPGSRGKGGGGNLELDLGGPRDEDASLATEARRRYLNYALSVITARALPDVRDGLKPVQRRILYGMWNENLTADAKHRKCANVVGAVMGSYHPHGDSRSTTPWCAWRRTSRCATRWSTATATSARSTATPRPPALHRVPLAPLADELLRESSAEDGRLPAQLRRHSQEPIVLPARCPQLLMNGTTGIAVGMATNIPPHNLSEVIAACVALIEDPEARDEGPAQVGQGPDFPTGGQMLNSKKELREIYETGQGSVRVRGEWKLEEKSAAAAEHHRHLDPVRGEQGHARRAHRRDHHRAQAAAAARRARRVDQRRAHRARAQEGRRRRAGDGVPLQAHAAADELQRQHHVPGADRERRGRHAARPRSQVDAAALPRLPLRGRHRGASSSSSSSSRRALHLLEGFEKVYDALDEMLKIIRKSDGKADAPAKLIARFKLSTRAGRRHPRDEAVQAGALEILVIEKS
jgi:DNA gyrase subunit A